MKPAETSSVDEADSGRMERLVELRSQKGWDFLVNRANSHAFSRWWMNEEDGGGSMVDGRGSTRHPRGVKQTKNIAYIYWYLTMLIFIINKMVIYTFLKVDLNSKKKILYNLNTFKKIEGEIQVFWHIYVYYISVCR